MKIGIIGLGWLGMPLAERLCTEGNQVLGTKRDTTVVESKDGIELIPFELQHEESVDVIREICQQVECLLFNIPPSAADGVLFRKRLSAYAEVISDSPIQKAIFISSSGVFGNHQCKIDEGTLPEPKAPRGILLHDLEAIWQDLIGNRAIVIRAAGLVGQERHPVKFLAGRTGISGQRHPVNLIHQDDLIELIIAVMMADKNNRVYHAVAGQHPSKKYFYQKKAEELSLELPNFDASDQSTGKRFDGQKSKSILNLNFQYDDPFKM